MILYDAWWCTLTRSLCTIHIFTFDRVFWLHLHLYKVFFSIFFPSDIINISFYCGIHICPLQLSQNYHRAELHLFDTVWEKKINIMRLKLWWQYCIDCTRIQQESAYRIFVMTVLTAQQLTCTPCDPRWHVFISSHILQQRNLFQAESRKPIFPWSHRGKGKHCWNERQRKHTHYLSVFGGV